MVSPGLESPCCMPLPGLSAPRDSCLVRFGKVGFGSRPTLEALAEKLSPSSIDVLYLLVRASPVGSLKLGVGVP